MQGQKNIVESLPETLEFCHGSTSNNNPIADQDEFWNDTFHTSMDSEGIPNYLLDANDTDLSYMNVAAQLASSSSITEYPDNHENHGRAKIEHSWSSRLNLDGGGGPRIEDRQFEVSRSLSLENVNISLNGDRSANSQLFRQHPSSANATQSLDQTLPPQIDMNIRAAESGIYHRSSSFHCSSSSAHLSSGGESYPYSSVCAGFIPEDVDGRPGGSFDGRRLSCKRKNIEGIHGQSSTSRNTNSFNPMESHSPCSDPTARYMPGLTMAPRNPSENLIGASHLGEHLCQRFGGAARGSVDECYPSSTVAGSMHISQRNFRTSANSAQQIDPSPSNPWAAHTPLRHSNGWSPDQLSAQYIPVNQSREHRSVFSVSGSQPEPPAPIFPQIPLIGHPSMWSGPHSGSRVGTSSGSVSLGERLSGSREEINSRSFAGNNFLEMPYFHSPANAPHASQDPTIWGLGRSGSTSSQGNAGSSRPGGIVSHPSSGPSWATNPNAPSHHLSELLRRSAVFPSGGGSGSVAGSSSGIPSGHSSDHSVPSQSIAHHRFLVGPRGNNQAFLRSAFLMDWRRDASHAGPFTTRSSAPAREMRSRMIAEIRNALHFTGQADDLRFEDMFFLDHQGVFYPGADLHDRHRDMRLDVDNMSYEELLALEERIGDVNTGLGEEAIAKGLMQRVFLPIAPEAPSETEPCCICQEEYVEGDDLGTLDCGHDFHADCIKQWLLHKNLCPVCKETGLVT